MATTVSEIMTRSPVTSSVPGSISEVIKTLIKENITGLPVIDAKRKYVGMLSRRDIFDNPEETQTALVMRRANPVMFSFISVFITSLIEPGTLDVTGERVIISETVVTIWGD